jgi:L-alanine-DL-glutamate epimerase-like enolase superfamily enzyme
MPSADKQPQTSYQRFKKHRDARVEKGWKFVKVWVPTKEDAEDVQRLAAARRAKHVWED